MVSTLSYNHFYSFSQNLDELNHDEYYEEVLNHEKILSSSLVSNKIRMAIADKLEELSNTKDGCLFYTVRSVKKIGQFLLGCKLLNKHDFSIELVARLRACNEKIFRNKVLRLLAKSSINPESLIDSQYEILQAINEAATFGYSKQLQHLIRIIPIKNSIDGSAILLAAENNHFECLEILLNSYQVKPIFLSLSLYIASSFDRKDCLDKMLLRSEFNDDVKFDSMKCSIENNDVKSLVGLLSRIPLNQEKGILLLELAAEFDNVPCFEEIYSYLGDSKIGSALISSSKHGSIDCLKTSLIYSKNEAVVRDDLMNAYMAASLLLAAEFGHKECLGLLLISRNYPEFLVLDAIKKSIQIERLDCLDLLLSFLAPNPQINGIALSSAISIGNLECVSFILENYPVEIDLIFTAIHFASLLNHNEIIEFLTEFVGRINQDGFGVDVHSKDRDKITYEFFKKLVEYQKEDLFTLTDCIKQFEQFIELSADQGKIKKALDSLMGPYKTDQWPSLLNDHFQLPNIDKKISGDEVFTRFWTFVSKIADPADNTNAKFALFSALSDSVENNFRICNPGKLQKLVAAVLAGRIPGIELEEQKVDATDSINMFFSISSNRFIETYKELISAADEFTKIHVLVPKEEFITLIKQYALESGIVN